MGDYVLFRELDNNEGIIEKIEARISSLKRLATTDKHQAQILASNIDFVYLCMSMNEDFNIRKLRNFLSLTYSIDYTTTILLTKKDLTEDIEYYINEVTLISDLNILPISVFDDDDISILKNQIKNKTCVFIGSSGVGKSTIINKLIGEQHFATKDIRLSDAQGRHTTVHRELVELDNGGSVIDSPGIRVVNSYVIDDMDAHFEDIDALQQNCRFRDCTHINEPGCAVIEAIDQNELAPERLAQYWKANNLNQHNIRKEKMKLRQLNKQNKKRF